MKKTGRRLYLSGIVNVSNCDNFDGGDPTRLSVMFKNILQDERKGYAYKVTFASMFPNVGFDVRPTLQAIPFALQTYSARDLRRMDDDQMFLAAGRNQGGSLAADNRTVGIVGQYAVQDSGNNQINAVLPYQDNYVIKGDAMITESLSIMAAIENIGPTDGVVSYYVELDEFTVTDNEEILLILNEKAQNAGNMT